MILKIHRFAELTDPDGDWSLHGTPIIKKAMEVL